jgi:3-oxoacyl-[acyl-carrier-protein] synthase II
MGVVSPLGTELDVFWKNLLEGKSGIDRIASFDPTKYDTQIAGEVMNWDPTPAFPSPKEVRRTDRFASLVYMRLGKPSRTAVWISRK